jgi:type II secretory pathway predicted ATPase ExeA
LELIKQGKKPVVMFIDEAHELHSKTLKGLKRLIEIVKQSGSLLTVVLVGHPKLKNDLKRPTMAEIGHRTKIFTFDGVADSRREFIEWLLNRCSDEKTNPEDILQPEAIELIAERSATALQILEHLSDILDAGHETAERPISPALVESFLANDHSAWVASITRHGYDVRSLSDFLNAKQSEVKQLFAGQLDPVRTYELNEQLKVAGLPGR